MGNFFSTPNHGGDEVGKSRKSRKTTGSSSSEEGLVISLQSSDEWKTHYDSIKQSDKLIGSVITHSSELEPPSIVDEFVQIKALRLLTKSGETMYLGLMKLEASRGDCCRRGFHEERYECICTSLITRIHVDTSEGKFVGVRRPNSKLPIEVDGSKIKIVDAIGSSGLDMKTDPGVPIVYAGFGFLMLTTCISFLSHAQVWALQDGTTVVIGGKSNRAKVEFPDEMNYLLDDR